MPDKKSEIEWSQYFLEQAIDALKSGETALAAGFAARAIAAIAGEGQPDMAHTPEEQAKD